MKNGFADWKLAVGGLVEQPLALSLAELRAMPSRTQITRHDCVEGWSCIGKWKGVPLSALLDKAKLKPNARYIVLYCADNVFDTGEEKDKYYESIALVDAVHPQTILAYEMNDQTLPVAHGAPLRLRVERQLGYKMAKYVMRIEAVDEIADHSRRPRRLLGRPRLRVVRRHLSAKKEGPAGCAPRAPFVKPAGLGRSARRRSDDDGGPSISATRS